MPTTRSTSAKNDGDTHRQNVPQECTSDATKMDTSTDSRDPSVHSGATGQNTIQERKSPSVASSKTRRKERQLAMLDAKAEILKLKFQLQMAQYKEEKLALEDTDEEDADSNDDRVDKWVTESRASQAHITPLAKGDRAVEHHNDGEKAADETGRPSATVTHIRDTNNVAACDAVVNHVNRDIEKTTPAVQRNYTNVDTLEEQIAAVQRDMAALAGGMSDRKTDVRYEDPVRQRAPRYLNELPPFDGDVQQWRGFAAAYKETCGYFMNTDNTARIRSALKGVARQTVRTLLDTQNPDQVIKALERLYGRPHDVVQAELAALKRVKQMTSSPKSQCLFANDVANCVAAIEATGLVHHLHDANVADGLYHKMTEVMQYAWKVHVSSTPPEKPILAKLSEFLNTEADRCQLMPHIDDTSRKGRFERTYAIEDNQGTCTVCNKTHIVPNCPVFSKMNVDKRWEIIKENRLCFLCLKSKHRREQCHAKKCNYEGCQQTHHRLLCNKARKPKKTPKKIEQEPESEDENVLTVTGGITRENARLRALLKIAPVILRGPKGTMETLALFDEGSTITLMDAQISSALGLDGPTSPIQVRGVGGAKLNHDQSKRVTVPIKGKHRKDEHQLRNVHTVKSLQLSPQYIADSYTQDCHHLEDIQHLLYKGEAAPKILIGQDNWDLIVSRGLRSGSRDQPAASNTLLGWVLHGCRTSQTTPIAYCTHLTAEEETPEEDRLEKLINRYFDIESLGIEPKIPKNDPERLAVERLDEDSQRLPDGRFQTGLLWKERDVVMPNNYNAALKRLENLEKRLDRDEDLKNKYEERMDNLFLSRYAEPVTTTPPDGKTWYLPHFPVVHPEKSKIRLVHDAAAKSHGRSLNDMLLSGPDLLQSLPGVVMRFRQHGIAVSADIKEMFMQIKIKNEDRDALRFLWRGNRREGPPTEYRMTSVIFGASSSPCTALYIKNRNAQEHAAEHPTAARAIEKNFYMDDFLHSFASVDEAKEVSQAVDLINRKAGFELRGWASNNRQVAPIEENSINIGGQSVEKTLGLAWDTKKDSIGFRTNERRAPTDVLNNLRAPTKREALSLIMSIFDPLGLISPITTPAKRIMQDTWRYRTDWDELIPEDLHDRWRSWMMSYDELTRIHIPRCYDYSTNIVSRQLHVFVDASEEAYAAAVYWRATRADGSVKVALVAAKSRVTPTRPISIPRLELQAAVLGARLAKTVVEEHDFKITTKTYWSDSRTALAWIRSEPRSFKSFVAHRLAEIETTTKKNEWRWVPTADNVADDATRSAPMNFTADHRWYTGPTFLYQPEGLWPNEIKIDVPTTGEERCCVLRSSDHLDHLPDMKRFSSWLRLVRSTARVLQFIEMCRRQRHTVAATKHKRTNRNKEQDPNWRTAKKSPKSATKTSKDNTPCSKYIGIQACHLVRAEKLLIRAAQADSFDQPEIQRIQEHKPPSKEDRLSSLSTFIDSEGVLRLKGRILAADEIPEESANPAVMDGKHVYTRLYVQHIHEKLHHGGVETIVNELRQRMWITKIRPTVKTVLKACLSCHLRKAKPTNPPTGDLPAARLAHHARPFSYTGLDYFGPIEVTEGRQRKKRYVALFTCLTARAVHLEVVSSLSADSAISAIRRFIARRGCPKEIWSDNATCFKAADRELAHAALQAAEHDAVKRHIAWHFLPPAAPFMAGVWERMVRTVKDALRVTLTEQHPSDETLATLLTEVEMTVNSRPLTHVSVTPDEPPALTPNMILLGPNCHQPGPGTFTERDLTASQHWRRAQRLADIFWRRWVREYMPLLQQRREPHGRGAAPAVDDSVLICDPNQPRNSWPRGRISKAYPGKDGITRVVDVTTSGGSILRRPVKRIVVLPK